MADDLKTNCALPTPSSVDSPPPKAIKKHKMTAKGETNPQYKTFSVICKLSKICQIPELIKKIQRLCVVLKQAQLEGWHLSNLHILRCLKEGEELPVMDQTFFKRCCMVTLQNIEKRDCNGSKQATWYPYLHQTFAQYWEERERIVSYMYLVVVNGEPVIDDAVQLIEINAGNMIALQFRRRPHQYICFRFAEEDQIQLSKNEIKKLVQCCKRFKVVLIRDDDGNETGAKTYVWDDTNIPAERV